MYHARFKGTHYEAGYKYGKLLHDHGIIINSCPTFPITEERINFGKECHKIYEKYYPELLDEIKGFVEGNQTSYELISTMLLTMYCLTTDCLTSDSLTTDVRCSCFVCKDKDNFYFGRNSDFLVNIEKLYMNVIYKLENSLAFNANTTAFIQMEDGINEAGLVVGITFIASNIVKPGLNTGMLTRYMLEKCHNVNEAIDFLKHVPIASGQTFTLADKTGNMVVVETNCEQVVIRYPQNNYVASTNVFVEPSMLKYNLPSFDNWGAVTRYETLNNFLLKQAFNIDNVKDLLSGKHGFICQYNRLENADTVWSVIYDLNNLDIYRVEGNPARKPYKKDERMKWSK